MKAPKTMDSREIAKVTGKEHSNVCRDIRAMLDKIGGGFNFESTYLDASNRQSKCYKLPYRETMILVSGYSVELRAKIVDRWQELEAAPPKSTLSAAYLREYRLTHGVEAARALIDSTMPALPPPPTPIEDDYAALRAVVGDKGARQVIAVAHKVALAHNAALRADKIQPRLM